MIAQHTFKKFRKEARLLTATNIIVGITFSSKISRQEESFNTVQFCFIIWINRDNPSMTTNTTEQT